MSNIVPSNASTFGFFGSGEFTMTCNPKDMMVFWIRLCFVCDNVIWLIPLLFLACEDLRYKASTPRSHVGLDKIFPGRALQPGLNKINLKKV